MKYKFLSVAHREITAAFDYYEGHETGVGQDFLDAVDASIRLLCTYPESGRSLGDGCRISQVSGYPYALVYKVQDGALGIIAIMHQHRKPGYWKGRI